MSPDPENNPYLPPASDPTLPETPVSGSAERKPDLRIKDPRSWGWAAITFIWLTCLTITLQRLAPPHPVWQAFLAVSIGVSVFSAIVSYLGWLFRVVTNAKIIHPGSGPSPGWAIGCHFIPFVNWVVPAMIVKEVADATFRQRAPRATGYVIAIWWTSFVLRGLIQSFQAASLFVPVLNWIAGIGAAWLIIRISLKQVDWREAGLPAEPRPLLVPTGGPRPVSATRLPQPVGQGLPSARPRPGNCATPTEAVRVLPDAEQE